MARDGTGGGESWMITPGDNEVEMIPMDLFLLRHGIDIGSWDSEDLNPIYSPQEREKPLGSGNYQSPHHRADIHSAKAGTVVNRYHCGVCDFRADRDFTWKAHLCSLEHSVLEASASPLGRTNKCKPAPFVCDLCPNTTITDPDAIKSHLKGKSHQRRLRLSEDQGVKVCETCCLQVGSGSAWDQHIRGKRHQRNLNHAQLESPNDDFLNGPGQKT